MSCHGGGGGDRGFGKGDGHGHRDRSGGKGGRKCAAKIAAQDFAPGGWLFLALHALIMGANRSLPGRKKLMPGGRVAQGEARRLVAQNFVNDCDSRYSVNNITDAIALLAREARAQDCYGSFLEMLFQILLSLLDDPSSGPVTSRKRSWDSDSEDDSPAPDMSRRSASVTSAAR